MTPLEAILKSLAITGVTGTLVFAVLSIKSSYMPKEHKQSEEKTSKELVYDNKGKQLYFNFGDDENGQFFFDFMKDYA